MSANRKQPMSDWAYAFGVHGGHCPVCESTEIEGFSGHDVDGNHSYQEVGCLACSAMWTDVYTLSGYVDLRLPDEEETCPDT